MAKRPNISAASEEVQKKILCFLRFRYAHSESILFTEMELCGYIKNTSARIIHYSLQELAESPWVDEEFTVEDDEEVPGYSITRAGIKFVEGWPDDDYDRNSEGIDFLDDDIPASDRVVSLDHNSKAYQGAVDAVDKVIEAVAGDNEYGSESPEEKEAVVGALGAARKLLDAVEVRISAVQTILLPPLQYIADNFSKGAVAALGAAAVAAVMKLFGLL